MSKRMSAVDQLLAQLLPALKPAIKSMVVDAMAGAGVMPAAPKAVTLTQAAAAPKALPAFVTKRNAQGRPYFARTAAPKAAAAAPDFSGHPAVTNRQAAAPAPVAAPKASRKAKAKPNDLTDDQYQVALENRGLSTVEILDQLHQFGGAKALGAREVAVQRHWVKVYFDAKPSQEVKTFLKLLGFQFRFDRDKTPHWRHICGHPAFRRGSYDPKADMQPVNV